MPSLTARSHRKKVAIIGSGSAGIGALWALNRTPHDVYIYEAANRLGGHTNTVEWKCGKSKTLVDTGFIVLNSATYPNFRAFLKYINIPTEPTEMTFSVSRDEGIFEWAGSSLSAVFAQRKNIFSPRVWRMIFDIIRFNHFALDLLHHEDLCQIPLVNGENIRGKQTIYADSQMTIGEYLKREGYSDAFRDDYLIPMTAAVWSTSPDKCTLEFPAVTLVRFMWNHHLLSTVTSRPQWLTIKQGAKSYIEAVMKGFPPNHVFLGEPVISVTNDELGKVRLHLRNGNSEIYDHVIIATHGDQALELVHNGSTAEEREILSGFQTSHNSAILHSDISLMPKRRKAWTSWNYITKSSPTSANIDQVCLTYNMNILQHIPTSVFGDVLVTLNPLQLPHPDSIQGTYSYSHPLYNPRAIRSQKLLSKIQNRRGISFAGAWTKYGFHEDGFSSGLRVAMDHLGAKLPFEYTDSTYSRGMNPILGLTDLLVRALISITHFYITIIEIILGVHHVRKVNNRHGGLKIT
ncbi:putative FAD dependent oxidoreductase [Blumeria hordei DH14]|uniref:Putative FAD dependent oxidoreductase n=1 Tax=Blumeria graminis f. sp. hordei (strain DH14) TaxID=546991 RepID=N1JAM1_BLUG1|nr:putative FAD dependent oxidoreductase [Blumeria hordei DH14]